MNLNTFMYLTLMHLTEGTQKSLSQHQGNTSSPTRTKLLEQFICLPSQLKSTLHRNDRGGGQECKIKENPKCVFYFHFLFIRYLKKKKKKDSIWFFFHPFSANFSLKTMCIEYIHLIKPRENYCR
uniref:Uncharacterized protein n=1 Tax=Molossus molossus TaxID=27622 RepID=A0A7J8GM24_MOLMO|nr:hypothetical protein HJG59_011494 [Molossus molossus]